MNSVDPTGRIFFEQSGILVHIPSAMKFPMRIGRFHRELRPSIYGFMGYNVSVGYNQKRWWFGVRDIALTVYVYPGGFAADAPHQALEEAFELAKLDVFKLRPEARLLHEETAVLQAKDLTVPGRRATFRVIVDSKTRVSELFLFRRAMWLLKYRISYPRSVFVKPAREVESVMKRLGFPRIQ